MYRFPVDIYESHKTASTNLGVLGGRWLHMDPLPQTQALTETSAVLCGSGNLCLSTYSQA